MAKLEMMKQCQQSFLFISTVYLKQQTFTNNILRCFSSLKNLKIVYLAISFSNVYFAVRGRFIQLITTKSSKIFDLVVFSCINLPLTAKHTSEKLKI